MGGDVTRRQFLSVGLGGAVPSLRRRVTRQSQTLEFAYRYARLPNTAGALGVTVELAMPDSITEFGVTFDADATLERTSGFRRTSGRFDVRWDRTTRTPSFGYTASVPTPDVTGEHRRYVDTDSWTLFNRDLSGFDVKYRSDGVEPEIRETNRVPSSDGFASNDLVFVGGPVDTATHRIGAQTLRVIVPDVARPLPFEETELVEMFTQAGSEFEVNTRTEQINLLIAPEPLSGGVTVQNEIETVAEQWVDASQEFTVPYNIWLHEYVHACQDFVPTTETEWLIEATADFYAPFLTVLQERISGDEFLEFVETEEHADARLTDPSSWDSSEAAYTKGRRVLWALALKIYNATDGGAGFMAVFRRLNTTSDSVTHDRFLQAVATVADREVSEWVDRYASQPVIPDVPEVTPTDSGE